MRTAVTSATGTGATTSGDAAIATRRDVGIALGVGGGLGTFDVRRGPVAEAVGVEVGAGAAVTIASGDFVLRCSRTESPAPNASPKTMTPSRIGINGTDDPCESRLRKRRGGGESS